MKQILVWFGLLFIVFSPNEIHGQQKQRPFILVKSSERNQILNRIDTQAWAKDIYDNLKLTTDAEVAKFYKNPSAYIKQLPFDWSKKQQNHFPPFFKTTHIRNGVQENLDNATDEDWKPAELLINYLQVVTFDIQYVKTSDTWEQLRTKDNESFITVYAKDNPNREDLPEFALFAYTMTVTPDRLSSEIQDWIKTNMPNRLAFLETIFK